MKTKMMLCLLWCFFAGAAKAKEVPQLANVLARQSISLNGQWNYIVDVQEEGYYDYRMNVNRWGFFLNAKPQRPEDLIEYDFDKAPTMQVPGDWNTQDERLFFYEGTVWLKRVLSSTLVPSTTMPTSMSTDGKQAIIWAVSRRSTTT